MKDFQEVAVFYSLFHRKLSQALNDLERRSADFYFLSEGLKPRLKAPDDLEVQGFWEEEAKRLMRSRQRDKKNRPRFSDHQQSWTAAKESFYRMLEELRFRYLLWKAHKEKGREDETSLALEDIPYGKLKKLAEKGITTTISYHNADKEFLKSIKGFGEKTIEKLNQKIKKPRKRERQPSLPLL